MKKKGSLALILLVLLSLRAVSQELLNIKGTISKEKSDEMFVICVFGTAACMPLEFDDSVKMEFNGKSIGIKDLPVGVYVEAVLEERSKEKYKLKSLKADYNKTVICFSEMDELGERKLNTLLNNTKGVRDYKFYQSSLQVYIEYDHEIISYDKLDRIIRKAGLQLE